MHLDIPVLRKCCVCLPLRYGIIIFGYIVLGFDLFILTLELIWLSRRGIPGLTSPSVAIYRGVAMRTQTWLPAFLYSLDIIFNIILLIGAHTKRVKLMRAYYYYGITTTLATLLTFVVVRLMFDPWRFDLIHFSLTFSAFALQVYLLLLIRSEFLKRRYQEGCISFYNNSSEVIVHPPAWNDKNDNEL